MSLSAVLLKKKKHAWAIYIGVCNNKVITHGFSYVVFVVGAPTVKGSPTLHMATANFSQHKLRLLIGKTFYFNKMNSKASWLKDYFEIALSSFSIH